MPYHFARLESLGKGKQKVDSGTEGLLRW